MEIWKDIKCYEDIYQISNQGRVRSKDRRVVNHQNGTTRLVQGTQMSPWDNGNGYLVVSLNDKREKKNFYVHRLVAEAFIENPFGLGYVNHLDYNKKNNDVSNLEWCTQLQNVHHSIERMKVPKANCRKSNTGEKYISKKLYHGQNERFRVSVDRLRVDKSFKTLEEAIIFRNEVIKREQINTSG